MTSEEESSVELMRQVMDVVKKLEPTKNQLFFLGCWLLVHALEGEDVDGWIQFIRKTLRTGQELCGYCFVEETHGITPAASKRH